MIPQILSSLDASSPALSRRPLKKEKSRKSHHHLSMKKIFIEQIRAGVKTIEVRPFHRSVVPLQEGDTLRFYYFTNAKDDVTCRITGIRKYPSFLELLEAENFKKCLPACSSLKEAQQAYYKIPKYAEKEGTFGVVAIEVSPLPVDDN